MVSQQWAGEGCVRAVQALEQLLIPVVCAGCGAPGVEWCPQCDAHLSTPPRRIFPRVSGPFPVWSMAPYSGPVAAGIVAFKEQRRKQLSSYFGKALCEGACTLVTAGELSDPRERPWPVIPAPSTSRSQRQRGFAHVRDMAEVMAERVGRVYHPSGGGFQQGDCVERPCVVVADVLTSSAGVDAVGLSAGQRAESRKGAIRCVPEVAAQLTILAHQWGGDVGDFADR